MRILGTVVGTMDFMVIGRYVDINSGVMVLAEKIFLVEDFLQNRGNLHAQLLFLWDPDVCKS